MFTITVGNNIKNPSDVKRSTKGIAAILEYMSGATMKSKIELLRGEKDPDKKKLIKNNLPYLVASHFKNDEKRHTDFFECSNGLILDIDHVNTSEILEKLIVEPLVYFAFVSPSGDGLKVGIRFSKAIDNADEYKLVYEQCAKQFSKYFGVETDKTSDAARACFFSYDPNYHFNPESSLWNPVYEKSKYKKYVSNSYDNDVNMQIIADLCRRASITDYHDWVRCGMALFSLGEIGRDMFKLLSLGKGSKDTERDIDMKFDSFRGVQSVNIGSFFHIMKEYGYSYELPKKLNTNDDDDFKLHRQEWIEERAAILEFDAGFTREAADKKALELWNDKQRRENEQNKTAHNRSVTAPLCV